MTALSLVPKKIFNWSEICDHVNDPRPLPANTGRNNQHILYYAAADTINPSDCVRYYLSTHGYWCPGPKPPKFYNCLFAGVGYAWDAINEAKKA